MGAADHLKVRCGVCRQKLRLPVKPGAKAECTNCKAKLIIPTAEVVQAALPERYAVPPFGDAPVPAPPPPKPVRTTTRKRRSQTEELLMQMRREDDPVCGEMSGSLDDLCNETQVDFG